MVVHSFDENLWWFLFLLLKCLLLLSINFGSTLFAWYISCFFICSSFRYTIARLILCLRLVYDPFFGDPRLLAMVFYTSAFSGFKFIYIFVLLYDPRIDHSKVSWIAVVLLRMIILLSNSKCHEILSDLRVFVIFERF